MSGALFRETARKPLLFGSDCQRSAPSVHGHSVGYLWGDGRASKLYLILNLVINIDILETFCELQSLWNTEGNGLVGFCKPLPYPIDVPQDT